MPARSPDAVDRCLVDAFHAKDLEALVALYEPEAIFVAQPGQPVKGLAAIRAALQGFLAMAPTLQLDVTQVLQANDLALLSSRWTLIGTAPDGTRLHLSGRGIELVRRQADGTWRYVIDHPYAGTPDSASPTERA